MQKILILVTGSLLVVPLAAQSTIAWGPTNLAGPAPRENPALAWCPVTQQVVAFGGNSTAIGFVNDTTAWNGQWWQTLAPAATLPSGRGGHVLATDLLRRRIVMFGGITEGGTCNGDTWEWDGAQWNLQLASSPLTPRALYAMASGFGSTYLFGGTPNGNVAGPHHTDTWLWNGSSWTPVTETGPTGGLGAAMAFDPVSGLFVLFGGNVSGPSGTELDETWLFDGATWAQDLRTTRPPARRYHGLVYDANLRVVVLHGGIVGSGSVFGDTWTYTVANGWSQVTTPTMPSRFLHGMTYDPLRAQLVVFGGNDLVSPYRGDTWVSNGASALPFGTGCSHGSIAPSLTATPPVYGSLMTVTASGCVANGISLLVLGFGNTCLGGQALPFPLNVVGGPNGCDLLVADDALFWSLADGAGQSTSAFAVPTSTALPGIRFGLQNATFDQTLSNRIPLLMSNGVTAKVGF